MNLNFEGKRVMIVEDDYFVATELANALFASNARVLGPYASLTDAFKSAVTTDLAVLDVDLCGEMVFPLADHLMRQRVPFVFCTGFDKQILPARYLNIDVVTKPICPIFTIAALAQCAFSPSPRVSNLIPSLRLLARNLTVDTVAADRLLELTLQQAIDDLSTITLPADTASWLEKTMKRVLNEVGSRFLH